MVSYYNPLTMYRGGTQQNNAAQYPSWYPGYHTQPQQQFLSCMHDPGDQQWSHHHHHFQPGEWPGETEAILPSPPITVSGSSELSSPGLSTPPQQPRPPPARSPYEWMKKPSYQSQPNPGMLFQFFIFSAVMISILFIFSGVMFSILLFTFRGVMFSMPYRKFSVAVSVPWINLCSEWNWSNALVPAFLYVPILECVNSRHRLFP